MRRRRRWLWWLLGILALLGLLYWLNLRFLWVPWPWQRGSQELLLDGRPPDMPLIESSPVQRAADFIPDLTVGGKLEFRTLYEIKAPFDESIATVYVENGAAVATGDPLVALDVDQLGEQLNTAWLDLTAKRQALSDLMAERSALALMAANAELLTAQEALDKLEKGPGTAEVRSAQLAISTAQLAYEELLARNDPNSTEVREARYALREAEDTVQRAQTAYNAISWQGDIAASSEAAALQSATIAHERARTAYEAVIKPPTDLEVQKAQNEIASAQSAYDTLFAATPAQIEQAKVNVAKAQAKVDEVENGPTPLKVQEAEGQVMEALNTLEGIRAKLLNTAKLSAPVTGQVVKLSAKTGQVVKEGDTLAVLVIPDEFKLTLAVSELYIMRIELGMAVAIVLDVLPAESLIGTVTHIAPPEVQTDSDSANAGVPGSTQFTTYPVTVAVNKSALNQRLRAGMSAQVTFIGSNQLPANSWLVPINAVEMQGAGVGTIQVMRGETPTMLEVQVTDQTQGEWVVVIASELQDGDMIVGGTASFLDVQQSGRFGP